jgi:hypothetical protein
VTSSSGARMAAEEGERADLNIPAGLKISPDDEIGVFLSALATILRETVSNLERTVSKVSEMVVVQPGKAQRDLVVTLQDFDRLQQEFNTLGDILACLAAGPGEAQAHDDNPVHPGHKAVAAISIADLKHRSDARDRERAAGRFRTARVLTCRPMRRRSFIERCRYCRCDEYCSNAARPSAGHS